MTGKKKTKPEYSWTFRKNAVEQVRLTGKSAAAIARQLNIEDWRIRLWIKEFSEQAERTAETDEVVRLRNEVKRLKEDNEFLKKAAAYFVKEQP